jgi:hypothetical protein
MMINNVPFKECLDALRVYRKAEKELEVNGNKFPYHSVEEYKDILDSVVGNDHYTCDFSDYGMTVLSSGQQMLTVKCRLAFLDDDYKEICHKESYGGSEIQYARNTGKAAGLGNEPENACQAAFKNACKCFGIFGNKKSPKKDTPAAKKEVPASPVMFFIRAGEISQVSEANGRPVYKALAHKASDTGYAKEAVHLLFYPNNYSKCTEKLNALISSKGGSKISVTYKELEPRDGVAQLLFTGFSS